MHIGSKNARKARSVRRDGAPKALDRLGPAGYSRARCWQLVANIQRNRRSIGAKVAVIVNLWGGTKARSVFREYRPVSFIHIRGIETVAAGASGRSKNYETPVSVANSGRYSVFPSSFSGRAGSGRHVPKVSAVSAAFNERNARNKIR